MNHRGRNQLVRNLAFGSIALALSHTTASADGFRNPPPTATGIAKGNAHTSFVEDSSAAAYNPANLALLKSADVQVGTAIAHSELKWKSAGIESKNEWVYLPSAFAATPLGNSGLVFGLGITTPHGQGTKWDRSAISAHDPFAIYEAQMKMASLSAALAMPVSEKLLFGAALDVAYSELDLKQNITGALLPPPLGPLPNFVGHAEVDGTGVGAHAGLTWLPTGKQRIALTYRSPMYIKYKGDFTAENDGGVLGGALDGNLETSIKFPTTVTAGYGLQVSDALKVEAQVEWLQWSLYDKARFESSSPLANQTIEQNWNDTWTFGLGGSYELSDAWTLNFGYAFLESPIPDSTYTPTFPDSDRHVISAGLGYQQGAHSLDVSYAYSIFKDRNIDSDESSVYTGKYEINADLIGITYKYAF